jgi:phenylacetate-CoA ligase
MLPIIDKNLIKQNYKDFKSLNYQKYKPVINSTSGSTGEPFKIFIDKNVVFLVHALIKRYFFWAGYTLFKDKAIQIRGPFGFKQGQIDFKKLYNFDPIGKILHINSALIHHNKLDAICKLLTDFQPSYIESYPSLIFLIAKYLQNKTDYSIHPKSIILRSEMLYPSQRRLIENVFQCPCFNFYGQWEYVTFAFECKHHNLHLDFELGITEIVKNGKLCAPGEIGEIVTTGLHNHSMPLIRYATGDYGYLKKIKCKCGRNTPILKIIGARDKDLIVTKKGFFNIMSGLPFKLTENGKIKQIQFFQKNKDLLIVRIVKDKNFSNSDIKKIKKTLNNYLENSIDIRFDFPKNIPREKSGKYKFVDSNVPIEFN